MASTWKNCWILNQSSRGRTENYCQHLLASGEYKILEPREENDLFVVSCCGGWNFKCSEGWKVVRLCWNLVRVFHQHVGILVNIKTNIRQSGSFLETWKNLSYRTGKGCLVRANRVWKAEFLERPYIQFIKKTYYSSSCTLFGSIGMSNLLNVELWAELIYFKHSLPGCSAETPYIL